MSTPESPVAASLIDTPIDVRLPSLPPQPFPASPHIASISPQVASAGEVVTITGQHFPAQKGAWYVGFSDGGVDWGAPDNQAVFTIKGWSSTAIAFIVPEPSGPDGEWAVVPGSSATVVVAGGGVSSNPITLRITAVPQITSISVASAGPGSVIVVTGKYFGVDQGLGYVHFADNGISWGMPGDAAAFRLTSWSDTQISFIVPTKDHECGSKTTPGTIATITVANAAGLISNQVELTVTTAVRWPVTCDSGVTTIGSSRDEHMQTVVTIQQSGQLSASTHIWDTSFWGALAGFHGAAVVSIFDEDDSILGAFSSVPYGIGVGQSRNEPSWTGRLTQQQINTIAKVASSNVYDPQYTFPGDAFKWVEANYKTIIAIAEAVIAVA
ncbi:MAG: IPT/TIG domain-containing protein [Nakamurella sp.]